MSAPGEVPVPEEIAAYLRGWRAGLHTVLRWYTVGALLLVGLWLGTAVLQWQTNQAQRGLLETYDRRQEQRVMRASCHVLLYAIDPATTTGFNSAAQTCTVEREDKPTLHLRWQGGHWTSERPL